MILELDVSLLEKIENLSLSQLVFLNLVLTKNQLKYQKLQPLLSLVNEEDIQDLINRKLLSKTELDNSITYNKGELLIELLKEDKDMFDLFYDIYPVYVIRPDGTKGFLRANVNKCRKEYNRIVGKSRAMADHINECLRYELENKMLTGKMSYMKTMWKWLVNHEWEAYEEQTKELSKNEYGTAID